MLRFFRFNEFRGLRNVSLDYLDENIIPSGQVVVLREALSAFVKIGWSFDCLEDGEKSALRVHALRVFELRGDLLASAAGKELDEACEKHLKIRALVECLKIPNKEGVLVSRVPEDLDEGVLGGSQAAQLLSLWRIHQRTRNQIMGIDQLSLQLDRTSG
jgi:hypothetical protein